MIVPDKSIRICVDRGGTFCDVHASYPDPDSPGPDGEKELIIKLLSQDPANYADAPTEGIRRILEQLTGASIPRGSPLSPSKINYIRLSTTVATNALLTRTGSKHALLTTTGLRDALIIGTQARPRIFDLNIRRPSPLFTAIVEIPERVTLVGHTADPKAQEHAVQFDDQGHVTRGYRGKGWDGVGDAEGPGEVRKGLSGEAIRVLQAPDLNHVDKQLDTLYEAGFRSLAIVLAHSYTFPDHENIIAERARARGFTHISASSALLPMVRLYPRGASASADAYLTPVLREYLDSFQRAFTKPPPIEFMASDGGLVPLDRFSGLKSLLSGPAGGVVGFARTSFDPANPRPVLGIDVGGTSTDVSRFAGRYDVVYDSVTAGVPIQAPQLDIRTVAAGGGSCLTYTQGLFRAGPASAGADPGPVCYRKGGPLALTDANLVLGRLLPEYFPKIFGPTEDQPLDLDGSQKAFEAIAHQVEKESGYGMDLDEIAYGFIAVANETMSRPIRALTEARGYAACDHILASFGGAGGQHACEIAKLLGIKLVLIHRYSSVLSAYGLALADRNYELQEPSSSIYSADTKGELAARLERMEQLVREELEKQGFRPDRIHVERMLNMRFEGTDTALMVSGRLQSADSVYPSPITREEEDFVNAFELAHKTQFGFLLNKKMLVDDLKVRGVGRTFDSLGDSVFEELKVLERREVNAGDAEAKASVYFVGVENGKGKSKGGRVINTPVYVLGKRAVGDVLKGPAIVLDETQTIVIVPGAEAVVTRRHLVINL